MTDEEYSSHLAQRISDAFHEQDVPRKSAMLTIILLLHEAAEQLALTKTETLELIKETWKYAKR